MIYSCEVCGQRFLKKTYRDLHYQLEHTEVGKQILSSKPTTEGT